MKFLSASYTLGTSCVVWTTKANLNATFPWSAKSYSIDSSNISTEIGWNNECITAACGEKRKYAWFVNDAPCDVNDWSMNNKMNVIARLRCRRKLAYGWKNPTIPWIRESSLWIMTGSSIRRFIQKVFENPKAIGQSKIRHANSPSSQAGHEIQMYK